MFPQHHQNVFAPNKELMKTMTDDEKKAAAEREARLKDNLMKFIKSGRGFIGIHAATDCCYEWPEYGKMINGYFDGHPWGAGTMVSVKVEPGQEKHPLVAMFEGKNVEFKEEIYQLKDPYDSKSVHMLLRLDTEKTDMTRKGIKRTDGDFGIAWARLGTRAASSTARSATTTTCIGIPRSSATIWPASSGRSATTRWTLGTEPARRLAWPSFRGADFRLFVSSPTFKWSSLSQKTG